MSTATTQKDAQAPQRRRHPDAPRHDQRGRGPARAGQVPVPRHEPLAGRARTARAASSRFSGAGGGADAREGVRLRRRPPGGAGRQRPGPDAGRVPAARARGVPHRRHREHRRRARRHAAARSSPASKATSTCEASSACPTRCGTATSRCASTSRSRATRRPTKLREIVEQSRSALRRVRRADQRRPDRRSRSTRGELRSRPAGRVLRDPAGRLARRFAMTRTDVIVIGGGQAGLAMSRLPRGSRHRPRGARARPRGRALAKRARGIRCGC